MNNIKHLSQIKNINSHQLNYYYVLFQTLNLLMEETSECVIQNSNDSLKAHKEGSSFHISSKRPSRLVESDTSTGILNSHNILRQGKISTGYSKDFWPRDRNQDKEVEPYSKFCEQRLFVICESCFWCASYLRSSHLIKYCPMCHEGNLDCMLLGDDDEKEKDRLGNDLPVGIKAQFFNETQMWSEQIS
jgi:hypothetical protein